MFKPKEWYLASWTRPHIDIALASPSSGTLVPTAGKTSDRKNK